VGKLKVRSDVPDWSIYLIPSSAQGWGQKLLTGQSSTTVRGYFWLGICHQVSRSHFKLAAGSRPLRDPELN